MYKRPGPASSVFKFENINRGKIDNRIKIDIVKKYFVKSSYYYYPAHHILDYALDVR